MVDGRIPLLSSCLRGRPVIPEISAGSGRPYMRNRLIS
jgi:hypothetical protein